MLDDEEEEWGSEEQTGSRQTVPTATSVGAANAQQRLQLFTHVVSVYAVTMAMPSSLFKLSSVTLWNCCPYKCVRWFTFPVTLKRV